jgi:hypothetical protein
MGLRREVFEKTGGFGSIYHYGEDIEFSHRIIQSGAKVSFLGEAYVYHKRRSSPSLFAKQIFKMGKARIQLGRINRKMLEPLHFIPALNVILFAILLLLSFFIPGARLFLIVLICIYTILGITLMILGHSRTGDLLAALFVPFVFFIQIGAYGYGMIIETIGSLSLKTSE